MTLSIGLVGCGAVVHQIHAPVLLGRSEYRVRYVTDLVEDQARSAAAVFGAETTDLDTLVRSSDAVLITTPPGSHAMLIERALEHCATVLSEKPFVTSRADAVALTERAEARGAQLYVCHFRRVFPQVELARTLVRLGVIGDVTGFRAQEGGRFGWHSVSGYTVRDPAGGVLWDTGSHTLDMVLTITGLDEAADVTLLDVDVHRDRAEPSHHLSADLRMQAPSGTIDGRLELSRREALPNAITITGTAGSLTVLTKIDDRVRLTTPRGTAVLSADHAYENVLECADLQFRAILTKDGDDLFASRRFINQVKLLEGIAGA